ncbi:glycosyltransferase family 2 protein [Rhodopirellula sp. JC639]|uniref:glycosyltransferase family 2 protein n=1 Tax=Stieleria mannarensis TaxID=2755585 RepID=UPI0025700BDA|nr:glycosyltransferase family 2 protein [Rhodopirellula sp. JC639]
MNQLNRTRPMRPRLTLIVPVYNEEDAIEPFLSSVSEKLGGVASDLEILFVNDGSTDSTIVVLREISKRDDRIRIIDFARNFGKEAALTAGLDFASGDVVVPIDVDLQDPPELIPTFLDKWREGYDVVYGVRRSRAGDSRAKRITAGAFYRAFSKLSKTDIPQNVGDFRLMDKRVVVALRSLRERNRFMKGLFAWTGFRSIGVPYERPSRKVGVTKWGWWKLWNFALDGFVSFSTVPLRIWSYIGGCVASLAFLYATIIIIRVLLYGIDVPGYASLLTVVLFLGGMQLLSIGIIGEYIARLFEETKQRPIYIVGDVYQGNSIATRYDRVDRRASVSLPESRGH